MDEPLAECANGCGVPPSPPSLVICRTCMDKIGGKLEAMIGARKPTAGPWDGFRPEARVVEATHIEHLRMPDRIAFFEAFSRRAYAAGILHGAKLCRENADAMGFVGVRALGAPVHDVAAVAAAIERGEGEA